MAEEEKNKDINNDEKEKNDLPEDFMEDFKKTRDLMDKKVEEHLKTFQQNIQSVFSDRLSSIENNFSTKHQDRVTQVQEDIIKTSQLFREVSRPLGNQWKQLFPILTSGCSEDEIKNKMASIETQPPIMQAFKALISWKEMKGEDFKLEDVIPALKKINLNDVANKAEEILKGNHDNKPITTSLTTKINKPTTDTPITKNTIISNISSNDKNTKDINDKNATISPQESLDDRHLLLLAKAASSCWQQLANQLQVDSKFVEELIKSDGVTNYQSAFRMLYEWRENGGGLEKADELLSNLITSLSNISKSDLSQLLLK